MPMSRDSSPQKSDKRSNESYDYQPVRGDRATEKENEVQEDVDEYKEHEKRRALATLVIQKWARGWKARKLTRMRKIPIRKGGMNRA